MFKASTQSRGLVQPIDGPVNLETSQTSLMTRVKIGDSTPTPGRIALSSSSILLYSSDPASTEPLGGTELGFSLTLTRIYSAPATRGA